MKKIGIVTIIDNNNYGNRLQNYAVQEQIKKLGQISVTLKNDVYTNNRKNFLLKILKNRLNFKKLKNKLTDADRERYNKFIEFNNNIIFSPKKITAYSKKINKKFNYFITGSDQVWNPKFGRLMNVDLLDFADDEKKVAFSASFGISEMPNEFIKRTKESLNTFSFLSVREEAGKKIIKEITGRSDVEVW